MPLSNEELRQLELMERALTEDDPIFAAALGGTRERRRYEREAILGGIALILGLAVMIAASTLRLTALGGSFVERVEQDGDIGYLTRTAFGRRNRHGRGDGPVGHDGHRREASIRQGQDRRCFDKVGHRSVFDR